MGKFRTYLDHLGLNEDTTSGDVAQVTTKLDMGQRNKRLQKGKKCHAHGKLNCDKCSETEDSKWN